MDFVIVAFYFPLLYAHTLTAQQSFVGVQKPFPTLCTDAAQQVIFE